MRALVVFASKRGGTEGLARMIGDAVSARGVQADVKPARDLPAVAGYDAVIVAGALYMLRWHRHARRFVRRRSAALTQCPVWLVSSGPLDDTARAGDIAPVRQVAELATKVGARGTVTFGGRLAADVKGFPAGAIAKKNAGDYRDPGQVAEFAASVVAALSAPSDPVTSR